MSMRGTKRASGLRGEEAGTSKRRRTEAEEALWQLRPVSDLKMASIYNRVVSEAPAELFRKDLISAMKLPDSDPLTSSEYWVITDTWKQDWERGVQVPVNPDSLPAPKVTVIDNPLPPEFQEFKLPKDKYIHLNRDAHYIPEQHLLSPTVARAEALCNYDLDATDTSWLKLLNAERARAGAQPVTEDQLERVTEELEVRCWDKIQAIMKSEEGLGIEYDENVICDVCRSPDSEDGNEMVFCDSCNICVHQACYGITIIPPGQWLCRPCGDGVRPTCVLCPNLGGAMKCTPSGHKWAHVSCVLWIPEVSIGCAERMEPITKISAIPPSRWSLLCVLCRERKGACIQCSVKTCKTAYHVTCAFKHGLEMRAIIEDENADDGVKLRSYCQKHSVNSKKEKSTGSGSDEEEVKRKRRKDMTSEEKSQARAARLQEIEREFDKHVSVKDISTHLLDVDQDAIYYIYNYWKIKRRASHNQPLLPPKSDDTDLLSHRQEQADLDKKKMFVQLRQDLERVRNLCYMVSRREKLSRSFFRMREQTFHKQVAVLTADATIPEPDVAAIAEANHGPSIYDRLYSHPDAADHKNDFDDLLVRIAGPDSGEDKKKDINGLNKGNKSNPYKKHYVNGSSRRSGSMFSGLSSEESAPEISRSTTKYRNRAIGSSTDEDSPKRKMASPKKKVSPRVTQAKARKSSPRKTGGRKRIPQSKAVVETSSEDETIKSRLSKDKSRSKTLQQMEKEMAAVKGISGSDSDELVPIRSTRSNKFPADIYSDSDNDTKTKIKGLSADRSPSGTNDSQQPLPRTKAAMKEFIPEPIKKESQESKKRGRKASVIKEKKMLDSDDEAKNKENIKHSKTKERPTDLIVPQRQAAKKASENMRSTTTTATTSGVKPKEESDKQVSGDDAKNKPKVKSKRDTKDSKDREKEVREKGKEIPGKLASKRKSSADTIAYVPQRQAAKKAAAHIKSGLGSKLPAADGADDKKSDPTNLQKKSPKKEDDKIPKSEQKTSSSSSSNSSCSSCTSESSSEDEEEKVEAKPMSKAREIKPTRVPSLFSPPSARPTVDLSFLDKVSRPLSSTSGSSDSESTKASRSDSGSPVPKRPRRRRKGKSISTDVSPNKAPDKKLKTSERPTEGGVPSPTAEREEPGGTSEARAATRARTRSITASGNMPYKCDARQRKPSKDDTHFTTGNEKAPKEAGKSSELSPSQWKTDEALNKVKLESPKTEPICNDDEPQAIKISRRSISIEEKYKADPEKKASPQKSSDLKHKTAPSRRMSVKEPLPVIDAKQEVMIKERRMSRHEAQATPESAHTSFSPTTKPSHTFEKPLEISNKILSPTKITEDFQVPDKNWLIAPSPCMLPPPIEKPGPHDKYMTEDNKSLDADASDKSAIKMIAKIQANLNENTMIKSPKTPMDARMLTMDHIDVEHPLSRNVRKRSSMDSEKKFITQDASHVQGVEISKSAKIPLTVHPHPFPNRSMFSPQQKDEMYDIDLLSVDDSFNHDEMIKPFSTYSDPFFFKEDSKEQGVQETLNLVDRLRMQLSTKKVSTENTGQDDATVNQIDKERDQQDPSICSKGNYDFDSQNKSEIINIIDDSSSKDETRDSSNSANIRNTVQSVLQSTAELMANENESQPLMDNEKWMDLPSHIPPHMERPTDGKYENTMSYTEGMIKDPTAIRSDQHSVPEIDRDTVSKQSDDSQSLSVVDHSIPSNDPESQMTQDHQNYDNNNSLMHSDCATISSPYMSREKWRESKITHRRSSASSTNSDGSLCSQKTEIKSHMTLADLHPGTVMPEMDQYPQMSGYSCPMEPVMPLNQYSAYPPDSPFISSLGAMPLLPMPLASPGAPLYPALSAAYSSVPLIPPLSKPPFSTLCAAFTSSSQNIALTTAMIAPPTPKPIDDSPQEDIDVTGSDKFSIHVVSSSPSADSFNDNTNSRSAPAKTSNENSNETVTNETATNETVSSINAVVNESKSPAKSTKSTKFGKSPGKSPGFSPKQSEAPKGTKRPSNRSNRGQRGRGRPKSRALGAHAYSNIDYMGNSIQSKLVGTVYDFDEEVTNDVDLKSLRDRRKSVDIHDRKSETTFKDSSQSPTVHSPQQNNKRAASQSEAKESKQASPQAEAAMSASPAKCPAERGQNFTSVVAPVLPGPVNMRTYQPPFEGAGPAAPDTFQSNLLMTFASGTADQPLVDIDEEMEKQLQSDLRASKHELPAAAPPPFASAAMSAPYYDPPAPQLPKVSLSDSRNQLKVKIKGPFLDANYSTSSVTPAPVPPPPAHDSGPINMGMSQPAAAGPGNLRRMRKKELLRQYQDMHTDEMGGTPMVGIAPAPAAPPPIARAIITIPKAVASMTSIPTREDYRCVSEPIVEKKKRKNTSGLSRELRHLEVSMNDDVGDDDARLSSYSSNASQSYSNKRRGRLSTKPNKDKDPVAPKLKIKIGANFVQPVSAEEPSGFQFRPPKKRIIGGMPKPSIEDLRREMMKYRRKVMADFEENEKEKKHKPNKSEKRKKKKDKKAEKLQVINSDRDSAPKLIIKIKRNKEDESKEAVKEASRQKRASAAGGGADCKAVAGPSSREQPAASVDPFEYDPSAPDPLAIDPPSYSEASSAMRKIRTAKVTPIRLKLSRNAEGSSYVMKAPGAEAGDAASSSTAPHPLAIAPINKHCEVR